MKIDHEENLITNGSFASTSQFKELYQEIKDAIKSVAWHVEDRFIINPTDKANGVNPIKGRFISFLKNVGWEPELRLPINGLNAGPIDAVKKTDAGFFAVEWETGNISSSHRALNKIILGILKGKLLGGVLVLPVRKLSRYLTDRVGNYEELEPYFPVYRSINIKNGVLLVIAVVYDDINKDAIVIPKGKDGNAKKDFPQQKTPLK